MTYSMKKAVNRFQAGMQAFNKKVFVLTGFECRNGQYRKVVLELGEQFAFHRHTGYVEVGTLVNIYKNGKISIKVSGFKRLDIIEPTSDGRLYLEVRK